MMKLKVTLFGVLTAISLGIIAPYASAAEPITIFGINWSMTKSEIFDAVRKAGYTCDDGQLGAIDCIDKDKTIVIFEDFVRFYCGVFNGCDYSLMEVREAVSDWGYDVEGLGCHYGTGGDRLCVSLLPHSLNPTLILNRGTFGSATMQFDSL